MEPMKLIEKRPLAVLAAGLACVALLGATAAKAATQSNERRFDAAAWPRELRVEVEQIGDKADDVVLRPDQTRKSMVRELVASGRLDGMGFTQVQALLGEGKVEDGVLFYALGDQPIDPAGRVAAAKAVQVD
jgi:hypothetical protein